MSYKVKLDVFEGPFDLLVYLIESSRMNIYDIKVSEITTQYLAYVAEMKIHDVAVAQEFMVLAAELIELKSKMLLPRNPLEEEGGEAEDPRKALVAKILEYRRFKEMAEFLKEQEEITSHIHSKPGEDLSQYTDEPEEILKSDMDQFVQAFLNFISRKQRIDEMRRVYERIERQRMSVENRTEQIKEMFTRKKQLKFSELIKDDTSAYNQVITFMSLLDLLRQGSVNAEQKKRYGDITVTLIEEANNDQ